MKKINGIQQRSSEKVLRKADNSKSNGTYSIENTPFRIVVNDESTMIVIGDNVVKICKDYNEAERAINNKDWDLILISSMIYNEMIIKNRENK